MALIYTMMTYSEVKKRPEQDKMSKLFLKGVVDMSHLMIRLTNSIEKQMLRRHL